MYLLTLVMGLLIIVNEVSPDCYKGLFGCFHQVAIAAGILVTYLISTAFISDTPYNLSHYYLWRLAMGLPSILAIIQIFMMLVVFRYDSPQYYIAIGRDDEVYFEK